MAAPTQRRALGALFLLLAVMFAGIAFAAAAAGGGAWVVAVAAAAIGVWIGTLSFRALRPH